MTDMQGRWTPSNIRDWFINHRNDPSARNDGTIELLGASFITTEPAIFGQPNEYIQRELQWYESMSLNVRDIPGETPAIWKAIAAEDGTVNSNYGYLFDRIAVAENRPQRYGTQGECRSPGRWEPNTLEYPDRVDALRAEAEIHGTLAEYRAYVLPAKFVEEATADAKDSATATKDAAAEATDEAKTDK